MEAREVVGRHEILRRHGVLGAMVLWAGALSEPSVLWAGAGAAAMSDASTTEPPRGRSVPHRLPLCAR